MRNIYLLWIFLMVFFLANAQDDSHQWEIKGRQNLLSVQQTPAGENLNVLHYRCQWYIDPRVRAISGKVRTSFQVTSDTASMLIFDLSNALTVDSVVFQNQKRHSYFQSNLLLKIQLGQILAQGTIDSVFVYYHGIPNNSGFGSFNKASHAGVPILWTMSCPYGSRDWWPSKQDLTDKADSIDLIITTPAQYRAAGNGKLVAEIQQDTLKTYHWKHRYPIASYLIATAITNYLAFTQKVQLPSQNPGDSLPILNFVYPESINSALVGTQHIIRIMAYYDSLLAPYPFRKEKYGHAQFGWGGGMEHQTMSFMTDFSFSLQAHELAHQWFGNYITCRSWKDAWLNEGFATYMAAIAEKRFWPSSFSSWLNTNHISVKAVLSGSVLVTDTNSVNRIFDNRLVYKKGALILHMLRWELGEAAFWSGIRNYLADSQLAYGFASTHQLKHHLELASGKNLDYFFSQWYSGQGYPTYQIEMTTNGFNQEIKLNQTSSHVSVPFFKMKVPIRFLGNGFDTTLVFQHDSSGQVFSFSLPFSPTSIQFDPEKWIVAKNTVQLISENSPVIPAQQRFWTSPNPFKNLLQIGHSEQGPVFIQITDALGKSVWKQSGTQQFLLQLEFLPPGIYWVNFSSENGHFSQKVVKD